MGEQAAAEADEVTPTANRFCEASGAAKTTAEKARMPMPAPAAETRNGSPPRFSQRAATSRPRPPPAASMAVSAVVAATGRCRICPP